MRLKCFFVTLILSACIMPFVGCAKTVDYSTFVSERRCEIYIYADDETEVKVQCVRREQPYNADGICGEPCDIIEVFVSLSKTVAELEASLTGFSGEMNYEAVENRYFASFSAPAYNADGIDITLKAEGKERAIRALAVKDVGVISCEEALLCVVEHDSELFKSLTSGLNFLGEISVRLIYDDGCYYYVGICDREGKITAYLLDGVTGKIIAKKNK